MKYRMCQANPPLRWICIDTSGFRLGDDQVPSRRYHRNLRHKRIVKSLKPTFLS